MHASAGNRTSDLSVIGAVDDMWIKLLQYLFTVRYYKNYVWCVKEYIIENKDKNSFVIDTI